jgi:hypothetical protein
MSTTGTSNAKAVRRVRGLYVWTNVKFLLCRYGGVWGNGVTVPLIPNLDTRVVSFMPTGPLSSRYLLIGWLHCPRASLDAVGIRTNLLLLPRIEPRSLGYATRSALSVWIEVLNYILTNLYSLNEPSECLTEANAGTAVNGYDPSVHGHSELWHDKVLQRSAIKFFSDEFLDAVCTVVLSRKEYP